MGSYSDLIKLTQADSGLHCFIKARDIVAIIELEEINEEGQDFIPKRTRIDVAAAPYLVLVKETADYVNRQIETFIARQKTEEKAAEKKSE